MNSGNTIDENVPSQGRLHIPGPLDADTSKDLVAELMTACERLGYKQAAAYVRRLEAGDELAKLFLMQPFSSEAYDVARKAGIIDRWLEADRIVRAHGKRV